MKIFITKNIPQIGIDMLINAGHTITVHPDMETAIPQDILIEACKKNDALLVAGFALLDANFFEQCSHLKCIALLSVGYDSVDMQSATKYKIPVSNTPYVLSKATAEIAFLLMINVARKAFYNYKKIIDGRWKQFEPTANLGQDLHDKTLGIFGLGNIGYEMALKCKNAYNMNIIYHNRNKNVKAEKKLNAQYVSFDNLVAKSDILSLHANLSDSTKGLFDITVFQKMKPNAIFINTARGAMHNEQDLKYALENKIIWGAGLDVTNPEPMDKNNPLLFMSNVCVLPHIGSATRETRDAMARLAAENLIEGLKGEKMKTVVNSEVYE